MSVSLETYACVLARGGHTAVSREVTAVTRDVLSKLARAWGGVRPHWGITVIPTCGAAPAPVMPQVRRTWGRAESRENPHVRPSPLDLLGFWQPFQPRIASKTCRLYYQWCELGVNVFSE